MARYPISTGTVTGKAAERALRFTHSHFQIIQSPVPHFTKTFSKMQGRDWGWMVQKRKSIVAFLQERVYDMLCKVSRFGVNFMSHQGRSLCAAAAVPPFCLDFLGQFADILGTARVPEMAICHPRGKVREVFPGGAVCSLAGEDIAGRRGRRMRLQMILTQDRRFLFETEKGPAGFVVSSDAKLWAVKIS